MEQSIAIREPRVGFAERMGIEAGTSVSVEGADRCGGGGVGGASQRAVDREP